MVAPVTNGIVKTSGSGYEFWDKKTYSRQKRPYDLILPFVRESGAVLERRGVIGGASVTATRSVLFAQSPDALARDLAWNKARSELLNAIGANASLGISLAQSKQAMGMIAHRGSQLVNALRGMRHLDASLVSRSLGISERRAHHVMLPYSVRSGLPVKVKTGPFGRELTPRVSDVHETSRGLANLWLEFWFGWKPAVADIYAAVEVLDAPFAATHVKGSGKASSVRVFQNGAPGTEVVTQLDTYKARFGADVEVTNPNLRLAQQMGILNPAVIAFDLVPWSFVLGWFWNIQDYLSSFTDFAGLTLHRSYVSQVTETRLKFDWIPCTACPEWEAGLYANSHHSSIARLHTRDPLNSVPRPRIRLSTFGLSPIRALTSISLLVQKLPR